MIHFHICIYTTCVLCLQAGASEFNAVAHLDYDVDYDVEATPSGYDAFADLVQMAVREDPSLANAASGNTSHLVPALDIVNKETCASFVTCKSSLSGLLALTWSRLAATQSSLIVDWLFRLCICMSDHSMINLTLHCCCQ